MAKFICVEDVIYNIKEIKTFYIVKSCKNLFINILFYNCDGKVEDYQIFENCEKNIMKL